MMTDSKEDEPEDLIEPLPGDFSYTHARAYQTVGYVRAYARKGFTYCVMFSLCVLNCGWATAAKSSAFALLLKVHAIGRKTWFCTYALSTSLNLSLWAT